MNVDSSRHLPDVYDSGLNLIHRKASVPMRIFRPSVVVLTALFASSAFASESNKWRLEFSGAAESAGEIALEIVPHGREAVQVLVLIERNDGENRVARKVKAAIDRQAGRWVDAELDDGEDVLVKRRLFRPRVSVVLKSSTVKDVRINFDKE
jgi:hypothetical protein